MNAPCLFIRRLGLADFDPKPRTMREIATSVAEAHGLTLAEIRSANRTRRVAWPRQEAMWKIRETGRFSWSQIGQLFGERDHTTALYGYRAHAKRLAEQGRAA